ncbi:hypothetical protein CALVIDRAFT_99577 [Calocera viscosa TUFC12733]|uniref:SET domain-containing protein n=1 Tax=Calocera viscosa (strain TUFC12733) TaxID=1330018 RepID=A0A167MKD7_CALVF|nr:hypothetical protein CALVIDRAFT_99577 [Calocera viscosa TUFC12733]
MRRGFLVSPKPSVRVPQDQRPAGGTLPPSPPALLRPSEPERLDASDPIHSTVSLLPLPLPSSSAAGGGAGSLLISFRQNLELLLPHPWADRSFPTFHEGVELRAVSGRGLGLVVVAGRRFRAGEVMIRERPLLLLPEVVRLDVLQQFDFLLGHLSREKRDAWGRMWNLHPGEGAFGVHRTNCVALDLDVGGGSGWQGEHAGTFEWIGRANHSCAPGAGVGWDGCVCSLASFSTLTSLLPRPLPCCNRGEKVLMLMRDAGKHSRAPSPPSAPSRKGKKSASPTSPQRNSCSPPSRGGRCSGRDGGLSASVRGAPAVKGTQV